MPALFVLPTDVTVAVERFSPIGLTELIERADLTERWDRKYLVDGADLSAIMDGVDLGLRALEIGGRRSFRYESVYFDTPELTSYLMAARRRPIRFKIRTRSYLDSSSTFLETKERGRDGLTLKRRSPHPFGQRDRLSVEARSLLSASKPIAEHVDRLRPRLTVNYRRSTLVDPRTWSRVTVDSELTARGPDGRLLEADGFFVVETKSSGHPTFFDRLLWRRKRRPASMSKYCTLMAVLDPTLPANKWNRTLREYFDWEPIRA